MSHKGLFITLEGGEGSGKSTQIKRLKAALEAEGRAVIATREPGGTPEAEKIRSLLVNRDGGNWTPMAECLLLFAGRAMHAETLIKPALAESKIVISDRFVDSTRAYQGYGHGLKLDAIEEINRLVLGDFKPDLTFILDLPAETGLERAGRRIAGQGSAEDRFERIGVAFSRTHAAGLSGDCEEEPERCRVIDAMESMDSVSEKILAIVQNHV